MANHDLEQFLVQYRGRLEKLSSLWSHLSRLGLCDLAPAKVTNDIKTKLEDAVVKLMDNEVKVEKSRQATMELRAVLGVSRQSVEAKSKHLGQEEMQKEEMQSMRFKEFQKIHKCQAEKAALAEDLVPVKIKLDSLMMTLDEKNERLRILENFMQLLSDHCDLDLNQLKGQAEQARMKRSDWDQLDAENVADEIDKFPFNHEELEKLQDDVQELKKDMHNHKAWYDEELKTKLFLSTRSKELKHRIAYYKNALRRLEWTGHNEDGSVADAENNNLDRQSDNLLVDGSPGVNAKEVQEYLSRAFGMRVLADYTMLKRLKEEIGVQGLAYLVEKIRLQSGHGLMVGPSVSHASKSLGSELEEGTMERALLNIAMEYKAQEEHQGMQCVPGMMDSDFRGQHRHNPFTRAASNIEPSSRNQSPDISRKAKLPGSPISAMSLNSDLTEVSQRSSLSDGRASTTSSQRRNTSLARLKKFLKF